MCPNSACCDINKGIAKAAQTASYFSGWSFFP
jgi:hypothetical protein